MGLQFTHVSSFACRGGLRKSRADCSAVGLYYVTIPRQQTSKGSLYITVAGVCCMKLLNTHILEGNAARQWHADSGKPRTFILCEKKHTWVCSNASTSLKNPVLVRVWPGCLSVKLHLCRLLFMQYKITWLVRIRLRRLVELLWRVFVIRLVNFAKPAWCCNFSKFVRNRVDIQVYLIVPVCVAMFHRSLWTRSQTFAALVSKWCWQVLLAYTAIRGRAAGQSPPKFSKTCSVVSSVEYISWLRPCLLSKIKS